jgi:hypothetical protein
MKFMASSAFFTGTIGRIGPKISSCITLVSGSTSVSIVGAEKKQNENKNAKVEDKNVKRSHIFHWVSYPSLSSPTQVTSIEKIKNPLSMC